MRQLVGDAMEPVLRPLVYDEPLQLVRRHRERGEKVYIVSATLQEIVEHIADDLGFDGAIGSTCEIVDGVYTGRSLRAAHGEGKAQALRELARAEALDLAASTAYSDSYSDVPFLEAVGHPVAANPDRKLRRIARRARLAGGSALRPEEARPRLAALGFRAEDVETLAAHFLDAERRGQTGHGLSRIEWLETLGGAAGRRTARARRLASRATSAGTAAAALGYLTLAAVVDAQLASPPARARVVVCTRTFPTGSLGYWVRRLADAGLVAMLTATSPRRLASSDGGAALAGTNPLAIAIPSSDGRAVRRRRVDGRGHARRRARRPRPARGARAVRRRPGAQGVRARARPAAARRRADPGRRLRRSAARRAAGGRSRAGAARARRRHPAARTTARARPGSRARCGSRRSRSRACVVGPLRVELDRTLQMQQRVETAAAPRLHAGEVVEQRWMLGLLVERLLVDPDRLVPVLARGGRHGGEHRLPRRDLVRLAGLAAEREHDRVLVEPTAPRLTAGSRTKTSCPAPSSCSFAVDGEARAAAQHQVDLLVPQGSLGVLLDDLARRPRARSRR